MAHYMTAIFDDKLCRDCVAENESCLPSPETLKKKIIVKVLVQKAELWKSAFNTPVIRTDKSVRFTCPNEHLPVRIIIDTWVPQILK